jgi:hypothetical protein
MEKVTNKGRSYTYVLKGEPEGLGLRKSDDIIGWTTFKERKLITDITFESQHDGRPLFSKAINIDFVFYFGVATNVRCKDKSKPGDSYAKAPALLPLLNFIDHAAVGRVYTDSCIWAHMTCKRFYDEEPRTIITITELYEKKDNTRKKGQE